MSKRGTTLIESVIAIFIISVVLVTFLEALNVAMTGTMQLTRKTSALNLAKSQIEFAKVQDYNASTGDINVVYGNISPNISDKVNYGFSGRVDNVSDISQPLQVITVNVSYLLGKQVQLTAYKTADGSLMEPAPRGLVVTDNLENTPTLPQGYSWLCDVTFKGYYHVFKTGTPGPISATWKILWSRATSESSMGAPIMAIYEGVPPWVERDPQGEIKEDGIIARGQANWPLGSIGDLPGPGTHWMCDCYEFFGCEPNCSDEENPIVWAPHHCGSLACYIGGLFSSPGPYPCCGACYTTDSTGSRFWTYDLPIFNPPFPQSGFVEHTMTTSGNMSAGTYTLLLFNAENKINLDSWSASVVYYY